MGNIINKKKIKTLNIIKNAGHCPHDEMPEQVNPVLKNIIQETM